MVAIQQEYKVDVFTSIQGLGDAHELFMKRNGPEMILSSVWDLFYKYNLTEKYGPVLIHRHWPINPNEGVVDVNGTSTAWTLESSNQSGQLRFEKYGKPIRPSSWMIVNGELMPYEFYFDFNYEQDQPVAIDAAFVQELSSILEAAGLLALVGFSLIRRPGQKTLEVTEGNANVTFPIADDDQDLASKDMIQAGWEFPSTEPPDISGNLEGRDIVCKKVCSKYCRNIDKGHIKVHLGGHDKKHQKVRLSEPKSDAEGPV
ncbi:hypothetical protein EV127DRAFT_503552 [Xylaria flabelliformis]|nr:hypothetical protein EV127DRAFT_503552 [Xylaria flabelliformis]